MKDKVKKEKTKVDKKEKVKLNSEKIRERDKKIEVIKTGLLIMTVFLIVVYFLLVSFYEGGNFTISLDPEFAQKSGLVIYENNSEDDKRILKATSADFIDNISVKWLPKDFIDNISVKWLPKDIHQRGGGSLNGENYFAYSFYIENKGSDVVNYWYEVVIDDVIKNADEAIRVMIYRNDDMKLYAKANSKTGEPEEGTTPFYSEKEVAVEQRSDFQSGDVDKMTIVVFVEGDDPDCLDNIIGGEMKMHMDIKEEHIKQE